MNFFNIALKNIKKKFSEYILNFVSTIFAVTIFNLFCSMYYNPTFEKFRFGTGKMSVLFKGVAIAVLFFSSIFVFYSNQYFIKTRKKEIALYSLLGMRKTKIALLMFLETFIIGISATICGTIIGTSSAGYFTSILMRFMGQGTDVVFSVDINAIIVTLISFTILFIINGICAYQTIYRYQLIDLLSASKQGEHMPKSSTVIAILSIILLIASYIISAKMDVNTGGLELMFPSFAIIILVSVGTYLLFCNMVPMIISALKRNKSLYLKITNFISISQISFRIKSNAKILSVAAILCATTITMISASYSLYKGLQDIVDFYAPYSYICKNITKEQHDNMIDAASNIGVVSVTQDDKIQLLNAEMQDTAYAPDKERYVRDSDSATYILSESQYLSIIDHTNTKNGHLNNIKTDFDGNLSHNECYFIDSNPSPDCCKNMINSIMTITLNGTENQYNVKGVSIHKYLGMVDSFKKSTVVLNDSEYERYLQMTDENNIDTFYGIMFDDEMASQSTVDQFNKIIPSRFNNSHMPANICYISFYKSNFALYGAYVFIGIFIGILFLLAIGSIMYYKMIIEAQDERPRYNILRKNGMNKKEVRISILKQLGITYLLPLAIGLIHTVFALFTYNRTLDSLGQETPTLQNAALVVTGYILFYGLFYLLSSLHYNKIVSEQALA